MISSKIGVVVESRPWGEFKVLLDAPNVKVKRITVRAGHRFSLQRHQKRDEYWTVVSGHGTVTIGVRVFNAEPGMSFMIPAGVIHRAYACPVLGPLVFIEVQLGNCFSEDDIERFEDDYGRDN